MDDENDFDYLENVKINVDEYVKKANEKYKEYYFYSALVGGILSVCCDVLKMKYTLDNKTVWQDIERYIDWILTRYDDGYWIYTECPICYMKNDKIKCHYCSYCICEKCFAKIVEKNDGFYLCPQCRARIKIHAKYKVIKI
jgi:hypothetical protein